MTINCSLAAENKSMYRAVISFGERSLKVGCLVDNNTAPADEDLVSDPVVSAWTETLPGAKCPELLVFSTPAGSLHSPTHSFCSVTYVGSFHAGITGHLSLQLSFKRDHQEQPNVIFPSNYS